MSDSTPMTQSRSESESTAVAVRPARPKPKKHDQPKRQPPYNVVLLDDDDHTYEYVIKMLVQLFGHSLEKAFEMAREVDGSGRVVVFTTAREHAELKRDQIHGFGADPLLSRCAGSMSAVIEPAPGA